MTTFYTLPRGECQTNRKGQPLAGLSLRHGFKLSLTGLQFNNILGLLTLGAFCDLKLDLLAFFQGFVPVPLNLAVVDEHVVSLFRCDEAVTFLVIKPFNCTCCHYLLLLSTSFE